MRPHLSPPKLLRDLADLWVSLGKENNGESSTGVLRACAMTLITVSEDETDVGETLAALMREHPSRAIVVRLGEPAGQELDARVLAQCWMPFGKRQQICCEQIEIRAGRSRLADVATLILGLTVPDLPVVVWCRSVSLLEAADFGRIDLRATKLIVDSRGSRAPRVTLERIRKEASRRLIGDLAWTRLTKWRESIAQIFENAGCLARARRAHEVRIDHPGSEPTTGARYLAAWLRRGLDGGPRIRFAESSGDPNADVQGVSIVGDDLNISLTGGKGCPVDLRVDSLASHSMFAVESDYELLREELSVLGRDPVYEEVLRLSSGLELG